MATPIQNKMDGQSVSKQKSSIITSKLSYDCANRRAKKRNREKTRV